MSIPPCDTLVTGLPECNTSTLEIAHDVAPVQGHTETEQNQKENDLQDGQHQTSERRSAAALRSSCVPQLRKRNAGEHNPEHVERKAITATHQAPGERSADQPGD